MLLEGFTKSPAQDSVTFHWEGDVHLRVFGVVMCSKFANCIPDFLHCVDLILDQGDRLYLDTLESISTVVLLYPLYVYSYNYLTHKKRCLYPE